MMMSGVCLSVCVAYIGPKSRTESPRKTKIGTEVAHVTWLRHHFQGQKVEATRPLYSPRRLRIRQLQRWPRERIRRGNLLLRCGQARRLGGARRFGAYRGRRGMGYIVAAAHLQLVFSLHCFAVLCFLYIVCVVYVIMCCLLA